MVHRRVRTSFSDSITITIAWLYALNAIGPRISRVYGVNAIDQIWQFHSLRQEVLGTFITVVKRFCITTVPGLHRHTDRGRLCSQKPDRVRPIVEEWRSTSMLTHDVVKD